jgi:hypothetical protein
MSAYVKNATFPAELRAAISGADVRLIAVCVGDRLAASRIVELARLSFLRRAPPGVCPSGGGNCSPLALEHQGADQRRDKANKSEESVHPGAWVDPKGQK